MTPERIASLIHEAWEKFTHAAYPDIAFYDSLENAIITAINETKETAEYSNMTDIEKDAMRYRWLRDHECNSLSLSRNDDHACNYVTAKQWIEENAPEDFEECSSVEIQRMKDTNTIWRLQIYPHTPVGFNIWNAATLDTVIDAAMHE